MFVVVLFFRVAVPRAEAALEKDLGTLDRVRLTLSGNLDVVAGGRNGWMPW